MSATNFTRDQKGKTLHQLHHNENILVLPNVWDPLSAILLESLGYGAVATASAAIAYSNGYKDGEIMPFAMVTNVLKKIVEAVNIPVTADIESGYASDLRLFSENAKQLLDTGIVGINLEDTRHDNQSLLSAELQAERIALFRKIATSQGIPLFINARTDVYLKPDLFPGETILEEAIRRGKIYKEAGADGFYPIILQDNTAMETLVKEVGLPLNILLLPNIPDFETLHKMGVKRVSLGPGLLKIAVHAIKNISEKLLRYEGMEEIKQNPVTGAFLNQLVSKIQHF